MTKMNNFIEENGFKTIKFMHNNSFSYAGVSLCGSRGWLFESVEDHDEKVLKREVCRLKASLDSAEYDEKIVFLHYPPLTTASVCTEIMELLNEYGIKKCYYGHLHGDAAKYAIDGERDNIMFRLISCDRLNFTPYLVLK